MPGCQSPLCPTASREAPGAARACRMDGQTGRRMEAALPAEPWRDGWVSPGSHETASKPGTGRWRQQAARRLQWGNHRQRPGCPLFTPPSPALPPKSRVSPHTSRLSPGAPQELHAPAHPRGRSVRGRRGHRGDAAPTIFLTAETYAALVFFFPFFDTLISLAEWSPLSLSTEKKATHPINRPSSGLVIFQHRGAMHFLTERQPSLAMCRWGGGTGSPRPSAFWHT